MGVPRAAGFPEQQSSLSLVNFEPQSRRSSLKVFARIESQRLKRSLGNETLVEELQSGKQNLKKIGGQGVLEALEEFLQRRPGGQGVYTCRGYRLLRHRVHVPVALATHRHHRISTQGGRCRQNCRAGVAVPSCKLSTVSQRQCDGCPSKKRFNLSYELSRFVVVGFAHVRCHQ